MLQIVRASNSEQVDNVRALMRAFLAWRRRRLAEDPRRIEVDVDFDPQDFDAELAGLPGAYAPPTGDLLLALSEGEAAGCVALRRIDDSVCELRRLSVEPRFHGLGIGRALGEAALRAGAQEGYRRMRVRTSDHLTEALALYERLGFDRVASGAEPATGQEPAVVLERALPS